ncbi:MAG: hypothetical protein ABI844_07235 [Saprospiraceae bacterium]
MNKSKINWSDGMLITKGHFDQLSDYIEYKDNLSHSFIYGRDHNYGLINIDDDHPALELKLMNDEIALHRLNGLFKSGQLVRYDNSQYPVSYKLSELKPINDFTDHDYVVSAVLNENDFIGYGEPNAQEFPPRLPYKNYSIKLSCIALEEYRPGNYLNNYLPIGIITQVKNVYTVSKKYIPPCITTDAFPLLFNKFQQYQEDLFTLYQNTLQCAQIARTSKKAGVINELAPSLQFIAERLTDFIADQLDWYQMNATSMRTWEWYLLFKRMARNVSNSFTCLRNMEIQDVKNFINVQSGVRPIDLTNTVQAMIDDKYDQSFVQYNIQNMDNFISTQIKIFNELKRLNSFISRNDKPYESLVPEAVIEDKPKSKKPWD